MCFFMFSLFDFVYAQGQYGAKKLAHAWIAQSLAATSRPQKELQIHAQTLARSIVNPLPITLK